MDGTRCGHCKQPVKGFGVAANGAILCHHSTGLDCYHQVTAHGHDANGSCCERKGTDDHEQPPTRVGRQ